MKSVTKIAVVLMLVLGIVALFATNSKATTANELKDYILSSKGIGGSNITISEADKVKVERFFANNTITDSQADEIKGYIDQGIALMNAEGVTNPNKLSSKAKKQELLSLAQKAAAVLGLTVSYDATEERLDLYKDGTLYESLNWGVESGKAALAQTGSTNYGYVVAAGVMLIAGIMLVVSRKKIANAEA